MPCPIQMSSSVASPARAGVGGHSCAIRGAAVGRGLSARIGAIGRAHSQGLRFAVWTVNRARDMRAAIDAGVDGICTDRPDRLRQVLGVAIPP